MLSFFDLIDIRCMTSHIKMRNSKFPFPDFLWFELQDDRGMAAVLRKLSFLTVCIKERMLVCYCSIKDMSTQKSWIVSVQ